MTEETKREPRLALTVLGALWLMAFVYAFVAARETAQTAWGLSAGAEVLGTFLGWQGLALLFAIACFGVSRGWPKGSGVRRLGAVPLGLAFLMVLGFLGVIAWSFVMA